MPEADPAPTPEPAPPAETAAAASVAEAAIPVVPPAPPEAAGPRRLDFRRPLFLSAGELRRLRLRHEEFVRALAARLSNYLRLEFGLKLGRLEPVPYQQFVGELPSPCHLSLFKAEPLRGVGILGVHPALSLAIVDRLLGGPARAGGESRDLSEIEIALLEQAAMIVLSEWCGQWAGAADLKPELLGRETQGQFLNTAPRETAMLALTLEAAFGECQAAIHLALPCYSLEPLVRKLEPAPVAAPAAAPPAPRPRWNRAFDDVAVPVTAIWSDLTLTARDLAALKAGDVLPLDPECVNRVKLRLSAVPRFEGRLGASGGRRAVAVTGALPEAPVS
jgi:flagellar motor switch protein FliM